MTYLKKTVLFWTVKQTDNRTKKPTDKTDRQTDKKQDMDKIDRRTDTQQASGGKDRWIDNGDTRCINNHTSLKDDIS